MCHFILGHNSVRFLGGIFTPLVSMETEMNALQGSYKIYNFALTVLANTFSSLLAENILHYDRFFIEIIILSSKFTLFH